MPTRFIRIDDETALLCRWGDQLVRRPAPTSDANRIPPVLQGQRGNRTMQPGDSFFLALDKQGRALIILTSEGTTQNQLMWRA
jgi:hypothetical protein